MISTAEYSCNLQHFTDFTLLKRHWEELVKMPLQQSTKAQLINDPSISEKCKWKWMCMCVCVWYVTSGFCYSEQ